MCGICGVVDLRDAGRVSRCEVEAMARSLAHRGPDDAASYVSQPVSFAFRRLSIVDLEGGRQPMSNEDGTVWIVFNGEIYNHSDLRPSLEARGHRYSTRSDTETIVHLYEEYGEECVHYLRGMFAFAIWDWNRKRLFCARDRLGVKPLYYLNVNGRFAFASEMKALFEMMDVRPQLRYESLPEFFSLGYLSGKETLFDGIFRLLPGHRLTLELNGTTLPRVDQYWDFETSTLDATRGDDDYVEEFYELFEESVRLRLMSDVPLGVFLSGGLDSASITAVANSLSKEPLKTFSVGYEESEFSELHLARQTAEFLNTDHREVVLHHDDLWSSLPRLIWHEDEPIVWPSSVALHVVSRLAAEHVKVVLTGEGADEVFAGYTRYGVTLLNMTAAAYFEKLAPSWLRRTIREAMRAANSHNSLSRKLKHSFLNHPSDFENLYFDNFQSVFPRNEQSRLFSAKCAERTAGGAPYESALSHLRTAEPNRLARMLALDVDTYLQELLMKQDQMSMAASIESRVPFLDHKLVEFGMRLPARLKVRWLRGKYILRRAMRGRLPAAVLRGPKRGFPTPVRRWIRHQLFEPITNVLLDGRLASREIVNPTYVRQLLEAHRLGRVDATDAVWRLLNFELWNRIFFDRDPKVLASSGIGRAVDAHA